MTTTTLDDEDPTRFRVYQPGLYPPWLLEKGAGRDWGEAFGLMKDAFAAAATEAVRARFTSTCPEDALPYKGDDSQIERMPAESTATYRARLEGRWSAWEASGTDLGPTLQLAAMGFSIRVKRNNQWDWDGHPGNVAPWWARMWVIVDQPNPFVVGPVCGDGHVCGAGQLCGIDGTSADVVQQIVRLTKKWTSSHVQIPAIVVVLSGHLCGDGHVCGDGSVCGGETVNLEGV